MEDIFHKLQKQCKHSSGRKRLVIIFGVIGSVIGGILYLFVSGRSCEPVSVITPSEEVTVIGDSPSDVDESEENPANGETDSIRTVKVYICGAVMNPAVYTVAEDARVCDVIAMAGGLTPEADPDAMNQAETIYDGEKIYIPRRGEKASSSSGAEAGGEWHGKVNINTADKALLMTLPGIGENKAKSIIEYRKRYGAFAQIEELMQVSGIGSSIFEAVKDYICVIE